MWVGTYVKELWSCRSFSRVSWVFSEDVSDAKLSKEGYVCKRIAVVSELQSRCVFFSPSRAAPHCRALHRCVVWQTRLQAPAGFSGERITTFFVSTQKKRSQVSN